MIRDYIRGTYKRAGTMQSSAIKTLREFVYWCTFRPNSLSSTKFALRLSQWSLELRHSGPGTLSTPIFYEAL